MPKTIVLAIFTLGLAAATLVTEFVSPYRGGPDQTSSSSLVSEPAQARIPLPTRAPVRQARELDRMQA